MGQDKKQIPFKSISESFKAFRDEGMYYVDKTGFIPYLVSKGDRICVVTRPRRFGKTLMHMMLKTYFEYRLDANGKQVDNSRYFEGLAVSKAGAEVLLHMGQYPVVYVTLKDVKGDSIEEYISALSSAVQVACRDHGYLLDSSKLRAAQRSQFEAYLDGMASVQQISDALSTLSFWLHEVTDRNAVILLDEYDVPLQDAALTGISTGNFDLYNQVVKFIAKFMSAGFKTNPYLAFGIISGCTRVAKESIFTGMNNPGVISVLSKIPDEFWGFTELEVREMLHYYDLDDQYDEIGQWYDGYAYSDRHVYNPWSLLNAVRGLVNGDGEDALKSYWVNTSGNDIISDIMNHQPEHREMLSAIISGMDVWVPIYEDISYRDLQERPNSIWSFLLYTGYLNVVEKRRDSFGDWEYKLSIPNSEIGTVMRSAARHWWEDVYVKGYDARQLMDALDLGDVGRIEREINTVLSKGVSCFDYNEAFYHGTLYGMIRTQVSDVKSNAEYGNGRLDLVAFWHDKAIVLELKRVYTSDLKAENSRNPDKRAREIEDICINAKLDEARIQIEDKEYQDGVFLAYPAACEVVCYAVVFCGRRCMVRRVG